MTEKENITPDPEYIIRRVKDDEKIPFTAHLAELRYRLVASVAAVLIFFGVCYYFIDICIHILESPIKSAVPNLKLTFLAPAEGFFVSMKVAFFGGLVLAWPIVIYQAWMFISPGLKKNERRYAFPFVIFGTVLFAIGISFCFFIILPLGLKFLITFGQTYWMANIAVDYYLSFCIKLTLAFGLVFELPLILAVLGKMEILTSKQLKEGRRYAIVLAFVIGAILTPPDVITQCLMAVPLIILFELSIYIVRIIEKKSAEAETEPVGSEE